MFYDQLPLTQQVTDDLKTCLFTHTHTLKEGQEYTLHTAHMHEYYRPILC